MNGMIESDAARQWFMHTPHAAIGMGGNAKVRQAPPRPESQTLAVGILAGLGSPWPQAVERLAGHLNSDRTLIAERAWERAGAGDDVVEDYDCLVLLGWPAMNDRERLKRIELYCRSGGSIVAVRTLGANMPGWPDFAEEVFAGRQVESQQSRLLETRRSDVAWHHPALEGIDGLIAEGEVYRGPRLSPAATILLTADDGCGSAPVAWTTRHAGGRIFCTTLGHEDDFREPAFLRLIARAVRWTAMVRR
jgi:hypothetical protein